MDLIGDFGLVQGVAAGDEADGVDHGPGTTHHWGSTLSWNGYDNSASRITGNVLEQVPRSRPDRASLTLTQLRNEPG